MDLERLESELKEMAVPEPIEDLLLESKPSHWEVQYGRLQKKMVKLRQQRDHWKERTDFFNEVLKLYPYAERSWKDHQQRIKDQNELQDLRKRVKEQELLIDRLVKHNVEETGRSG